MGIFILIAGGGTLAGRGIWLTREVWKVRQWEPVACTIKKAELEIPASIRSSTDAQPRIAFEFPWRGQTVSIADGHLPSADERSRRIEDWEHAFHELRTHPRRLCMVNPEDPREVKLVNPDYTDALFFFIPRILMMTIGAVMAVQWVRRTGAYASTPKSPVRQGPWHAAGTLTLILVFMSLGGLLMGSGMKDLYENADLDTRVVKRPCTMIVSTVFTRFAPDLLFRYEWDGQVRYSSKFDFGRRHSGWSAQEDVDRYPAGSAQECWIDPKRPWTAALEKRFDTPRRWLLPGASFIGVGLLALVIWLRQGGCLDQAADHGTDRLAGG